MAVSPKQRAAIAESDRARAGVPRGAEGVSKADMAAHPHLMGSQHFSGPRPGVNPARVGVKQSDGMADHVGQMSKTFIGG